MSDTHAQFRAFLDEVRVKEQKRASLKTSRKANRDRIRKHFREVRGEEAPMFHGQGSQSMHTGVVPLSGNFDVDDGVYLQSIGTDRSKWPTAATVHGWIIDAVGGVTNASAQSRARCVRVRYAADYHVDLPVYGKDGSGLTYLFEKDKDPLPMSDPKGFIDWFQEKCDANSQIRDVVRYMKAWRDNKGATVRPLKGVVITILVARLAVENERDDKAVVAVAKAMAGHIRYGGRVDKPVAPWEDLSSAWSEEERKSLADALENLAARGQDAIDEEDPVVAAKIWQKEMGSRFPVPAAKEQSQKANGAVRTSSPAILGPDGRSA